MQNVCLGLNLLLGSGVALADTATASAVEHGWQAVAGWLALGVCAGLFLLLAHLWKRARELRVALIRADERAWSVEQAAEQRLEQLRAEFVEFRDRYEGYLQEWPKHQQSWSEFQERFALVELHAGVCVPPKPPSSGMNINKHVEVARLAGEGWQEFEIAEELAIPVGEVRLLLHLERNQAAQPARKRGNRMRSNPMTH